METVTKIEIPSKKRPFKAVIAILTIILLTSGITYFNLIGSTISSFVWWKALILLVVVIAYIIFLKQLIEFISISKLTVVVEIPDDEKVIFYNVTGSGKKINVKNHPLKNMERIYINKKKSMKGLIQDKNLQYKLVKPDPFKTEDIKVLPELFEASENDLQRIMAFIQSKNPKIEIGYVGIWKEL